MAVAKGKLRVFIEDPNGQVIEATGHVKNISIEQAFQIPVTSWDGVVSRPESNITLELVGVNHTIYDALSFKSKVLTAQAAPEWKCDWCGVINPRAATYCGELHKHAIGCGGHRSLIYDL